MANVELNHAYIGYITKTLNTNLRKADFFTDQLRNYFDVERIDELTEEDTTRIHDEHEAIAIYVSELEHLISELQKTTGLLAQATVRKAGVA